MLNVKGNFPGSSNNTLCTYCHAVPETQQYIIKECTGFDDLTGEANFKKEAIIMSNTKQYYRVLKVIKSY